MQFINEQQDLAFGLFHFIQNGLQPLLEFAAVFGTGYQSTHIQREDALVLQRLGHFLLDDPLGQALYNGGLADAGLTNEDRVVFCLPGQDPDHIPDLLITADHRVHLLLPGLLYQVCAIFLQGIIGALGAVGCDSLVAPDGLEGLEHRFLGDAVVREEPGNAALGIFQQS